MSGRKTAAVVCIFLVLVLGLSLAAGCGEKEPTGKPELSTAEPTQGPPGTEIKIIGANLGSSQGTSVVHVGDQVAEVTAWADTLVTAKVPDGLAAAVQGITVLTAQGESNEIEFTVTSKAPAPDRKEGQVEHPTPVSAMLDFMRKKGINTSGWSFSVVKVSTADPNWKIDQATQAGKPTMFFLLKKVNNSWTVIDEGSALTPQELQGDGAPSDLWIQVPPPAPPVPQNQLQVVTEYMQAKGVDMTGVTVGLVKTSKSDPSWELFQAVFPPERQMLNYYIVLHLENNQWTVKNYDTNIDNTPGMPADLKP